MDLMSQNVAVVKKGRKNLCDDGALTITRYYFLIIESILKPSGFKTHKKEPQIPKFREVSNDIPQQ